MKTLPNNSLVMSYLDLRKAIGIIGMSLPFVLAFGKIIIDGPGIQSSMSAYYYTIMGDVFVGSLCAIAVFLMSYRGYEPMDSTAGKLASIFAIGTALFPTTPPTDATSAQMVIAIFHGIFAASLFLAFAFFCLVLFRKTNPNKPPTSQKIKRNFVYTICGIGILICVAAAVLVNFLPEDSTILRWMPIFWLETLAILFFGLSWFVKGEAILKDEVEVA